MSKKFRKKETSPDSRYQSIEVGQFINHIMKNGKKSLARRILYRAFDIIKKKSKSDPLDIFKRALENVGPVVEVKAKRVGGATYQVPREVPVNRRFTLAMRWILEAARKKKGKPMEMKLADELIAAAKEEGEAIRKRVNVHRMAEANRAFAHFAR